eukprot:NODE_732_length_721_cov_85.241071_g666_i0.p2 GENE.NODE_732_length_721_cov_85.241071_g666_i0~~NODE_732_length_721_cov_85.241071_g666_i0.p2  ORF type:complete len:91 (+),score=16.91 NODE_732_length_721_cov_85.241071_g666_i0:134-406(+)
MHCASKTPLIDGVAAHRDMLLGKAKENGCTMTGNSVKCDKGWAYGTGSVTDKSEVCVEVGPFYIPFSNQAVYNLAKPKIEEFGLKEKCDI